MGMTSEGGITSLLAALAVAPWTHPLAFDQLRGWHAGSSGNRASLYSNRPPRAVVSWESTAWVARGVRYRDSPTADPPNRTLEHLPADAVIVWAVIYSPAAQDDDPLHLTLAGARRLACCEAVPVRGGEWELSGVGRGRAYSVIVRIYFGSRPTAPMRREAQRALNHLELPAPRPGASAFSSPRPH
jgi:hypothetical protein